MTGWEVWLTSGGFAYLVSAGCWWPLGCSVSGRPGPGPGGSRVGDQKQNPKLHPVFCLFFCYRMLKSEDCALDCNLNNGPAPGWVSFSGCLQTPSSACWSLRCTGSHPDSLNSSTWSSGLWDRRERKWDFKKGEKRDSEASWTFMMSVNDIWKPLVTTCVLYYTEIWTLFAPHSIISHFIRALKHSI